MALLPGPCQIRSDFVLVSGDTVSNMSLEVVLAEHRERRKKDKHAVLTMVLQRSQLHPIPRQVTHIHSRGHS